MKQELGEVHLALITCRGPVWRSECVPPHLLGTLYKSYRAIHFCFLLQNFGYFIPSHSLSRNLLCYHPQECLAWRIPCTEESDGLQSMGSQGVRHDWATNTFTGMSPALVLGSRKPSLSRGHCPGDSLHLAHGPCTFCMDFLPLLGRMLLHTRDQTLLRLTAWVPGFWYSSPGPYSAMHTVGFPLWFVYEKYLQSCIRVCSLFWFF